MNAPGVGTVLPVTPVDAMTAGLLGTILVLENNLDVRAVALVGQAAGHARLACHRLGSDHPPSGLRPSAIVAGLPSGQRRLPAQVIELAERTFPTVPVILLCREPLARPVVELAGGRLSLLQIEDDSRPLGDVLRSLGSRRSLPPADPTPRIRRWQGSGWLALQVDGQAEAVIPRADGVLAVHAAAAAARIAGDLDRIAEACIDPVAADRLIPGHLHPGPAAMVRLAGDTWLLAAQDGMRPTLLSSARLPQVWTMPGALRWIPAKTGDVVVVGPPASGFAPGTPAGAIADRCAAGSTPALIIELVR